MLSVWGQIRDIELKRTVYLCYDSSSNRLVWMDAVQQPFDSEKQEILFQKYHPNLKKLINNLETSKQDILKEIALLTNIDTSRLEAKLQEGNIILNSDYDLYKILEQVWPLFDHVCINDAQISYGRFIHKPKQTVSEPTIKSKPTLRLNRIRKGRAKRKSIYSPEFKDNPIILGGGYLIDDEAAERLHVFPSTIDILVKEDKLSPVVQGDTNFITSESVEKLEAVWSESVAYMYREKTRKALEEIS